MKVVLRLLGVIALAAGLYVVFFPADRFLIFHRLSRGPIVFSRTKIFVENPPERYATNGFDHIAPYVSRLLTPGTSFKSLLVFASDGNRGFLLTAKDGKIEADLSVDRQRDAAREATVRSFFKAMDVNPSQDYLAANGGVADATRILSYPIAGNAIEVTTLTRRILQELCNVSPAEALNFTYNEK